MWISQLDLVGWRNHHRSSLLFQQGVNVLIGPNGQGKTNVVEAVRFLAHLSSHRVSGSAALIGDGSDQATIYGTFAHGTRDVSVGITLKRNGTNEATVSGNSAKLAEVPRWVSAVMFAPEDSSLVRGEPGFRRQFLDDLVVATSPAMAGVYADFDKVLRQRNSLLKSLRTASRTAEASTLEVWNASFVALAADIVYHRMASWGYVARHISDAYEKLASGQLITASYQAKGFDADLGMTRAELENQLAQAILEVSSAERDRGLTLVGPQRDDIDLFIDGRPARTHASQGETWSLALSLRLGVAAWLRQERSSGDPIIILDDVFAELDAHRRARLVSVVSDYEQLLVTSAVEEDLPAELTGVSFDVSQGQVTRR